MALGDPKRFQNTLGDPGRRREGGAQRPVSYAEIHWGFCVSKSEGFALKSRVVALLGANALDFGAKADGFPFRELEGRSPSKVARGVEDGSPPTHSGCIWFGRKLLL